MALACAVLVVGLAGCRDAGGGGMDAGGAVAEFHRIGNLMVAPAELDFGRIRSDEPVEGVFHLRSSGGTRTIDKVEATCGCTVVEPSTKRLTPNRTVDVVVRLNPRGRSGPFQKSVIIRLKGETGQGVSLAVKAKIEPVLDVGPRALRFAGLRPGARPKPLTVRVSSLHEDFEVGEGKIEGEGFRLVARKGPRTVGDAPRFQRKEFTFIVGFDGAKEPGRYRGLLRFRCADDREPEIRIPLIADVEYPILVRPLRLTWALGAEPQKIRQPIRLLRRKGGRLKILTSKVEWPTEDSWRLKELAGDPALPQVKTLVLEGRLPALADFDGPVRTEGRIILTVDAEEQSEIVIPLVLFARR